MLKSIYRVDFWYNDTFTPATLERYKQDHTETLCYLLTRRETVLENGNLRSALEKGENADMVLLVGDLTSEEALPLVQNCFRFIRDFRGEVPGASAKDCGNYLDMNLPMANYWGAKYAALLENITPDRLVYPE